jgi:hypothetical protein
MTHHGGGTRRRRKYPRSTYHRIKCNVCSHPDRHAIDEAFLRWESPEKLARQYGLADHSSIYRHVHATGLYARRRRTICTALESIIEHAERVDPTASEVVQAIRLYSQFNDQGEWVEPPKRRIVHCFTTPIPETGPHSTQNQSPTQTSMS